MVDTNSSMTLSQLLKNEFADDVRQRAELDLRSHPVRVRNATPWNLMATVGGAEVSIDLDDDGDLYLWCDCDYLQEFSEGCEHLWATILVAEQKHLLMEVMHRPDLNVMFVDEASSWDPDGGFDEDADPYEPWDEDQWPKPPAPRPNDKAAKNSTKRKKNQSNEWSRAFEQIRQVISRPSGDLRNRWKVPSITFPVPNDQPAQRRPKKQGLGQRQATSLRAGRFSIVGPRAVVSRDYPSGTQKGRQLEQTNASFRLTRASRTIHY